MTTATITFSDLEWRSYSIMADAGQAVACVRQHSNIALKHWKLLGLLSSMAKRLRSGVLDLLTEPTAISALENASQDELADIARQLGDMCDKVIEMLQTIHSLDGKLGYWQRLYNSRIGALEELTAQLNAHVAALQRRPVLLLTARDQKFLTDALLRAAEPNAALRKAFATK